MQPTSAAARSTGKPGTDRAQRPGPGRRRRAAEAIPLLEQTLAALERVLGPDHPHTLNSRNNLAAAYRAADQAD